MTKALSSSSCRDGDGSPAVLVVDRNQLSGKVKIGEGFFSNVYRSLMTRPGGDVTVALKEGKKGTPQETLQLWNEALILLKVRHVAGVPRLYGMASTTPPALVMSLCPGLPMKTWLNAEGVRVYLEALRRTCLIISSLHKLGVVHRDLHNDNILVTVTEGCGVSDVVVIDFGEAKVTYGKSDKILDALKLKCMASQVMRRVTRTSDEVLYRKCQQLQKLVEESRSIKQLMTIVGAILEQ